MVSPLATLCCVRMRVVCAAATIPTKRNSTIAKYLSLSIAVLVVDKNILQRYEHLFNFFRGGDVFCFKFCIAAKKCYICAHNKK